MERETKFRGKCVKTGKWLYGGITAKSHTIDDKTFIISNKWNEGNEENEHLGFNEVDPKTVGQLVKVDMYQGKRFHIFDKDIVLVEIPYNDNTFKAEVFYDESTSAFRLKIYKKEGIFIDWLTVITVKEVIGNKIDNPELLNN